MLHGAGRQPSTSLLYVVLLILSTSGQWDKAACVYKSTQLEELSDVVGLALAYCRSGHLTESRDGEDRNTFKSVDWGHVYAQQETVNSCWLLCCAAYDRALALAATEKEKAYILTAQALLQHQQGNLDLAKTLLFKW